MGIQFFTPTGSDQLTASPLPSWVTALTLAKLVPRKLRRKLKEQ